MEIIIKYLKIECLSVYIQVGHILINFLIFFEQFYLKFYNVQKKFTNNDC